jgi:membrane glycosyltransferase
MKLALLLWSALTVTLLAERAKFDDGKYSLDFPDGWKAPEGPRLTLPQGLPEALSGLALTGLVVTLNPVAAIWLVPVAGPMIAAPALIRWLNGLSPQAAQA